LLTSGVSVGRGGSELGHGVAKSFAVKFDTYP
jgi:hypothetical protein